MRKPFEGIFGNTPELRMLEFLLPLEGIDFNITELAEEVGISRPTAQKIVKKFLEYGILKISMEKGGVKYYELNTSSPFVRLIDEINNVLIAKMVGPEVMQEVEDYWNAKKGSREKSIELYSDIENLPLSTTLMEEEGDLIPYDKYPLVHALDKFERGDLNAA